MTLVDGSSIRDIPRVNEWTDSQEVSFPGCVLKVRGMKDFAFLMVRTARHYVQVIWSGSQVVHPGSQVEVTGVVHVQERAPNGLEVHASDILVVATPEFEYPLRVGDRKLGCSLEANLDLRGVALRNVYERAVMKLQEGIVSGFREFCLTKGFTEIHSPKIVSQGAEGGANMFEVDYFSRPALLSQSPQMYKQACVAIFDRVFEIGAVYRAENHNSPRHLNEYIGLDMEMGFISGMDDVMNMETAMLKSAFDSLKRDYSHELHITEAIVPEIESIPSVTFEEAMEIVGKSGKRFDLDGSDEELLCQWAEKEYGSEFIFVTHFPAAKRPFYAMDDPVDSRFALSFDLLFRGLEITTGGQRIHEYSQQVEKMQRMGLDPDDFSDYLSLHKYGVPPHGGLGIGLERVLMKLLKFDNVRRASLFPRDVKRITP
jgi:nondiscriminating aspartyl-tRNA synthetase